MGQSITPKYVVEIKDGTSAYMTPASWEVRERPRFGMKGHGKPTDKNLEAYVMAYAKSLEIGGANQHISLSLGFIPYPTSAIIRENRVGGKVVATWKVAMFQIW